MTLNELKNAAGVSIVDIGDYLKISYIDVAKIFCGDVKCEPELKNNIKIFLIENYTKCIEELL